MNTPIQYDEIPWPIKDKYIDEETMEFARWIIFGEYQDGSNAVDIHWATGGMDVICRIPRDKAERIIEARNKFASEVCNILNDSPNR
jgi:hypothetical protein